MQTLAGKTAVVTGASRGSGRAAALALARAGAQVIVHHGQRASDAEAVVGEIRGIGSRSNAIAADLSAQDGPHRLARQVRAIVGDRLDILVAHTGSAADIAAVDVSREDFDHVVATRVRAPYFLVQQLLPILCKGSSVTFLLNAGRAAVGTPSIDAACGGAVQTLVGHFAAALGGRGIRVNGIAVSSPPLGSIDVGSIVTFLASDAARWITGDIVHIHGAAGL